MVYNFVRRESFGAGERTPVRNVAAGEVPEVGEVALSDVSSVSEEEADWWREAVIRGQVGALRSSPRLGSIFRILLEREYQGGRSVDGWEFGDEPFRVGRGTPSTEASFGSDSGETIDVEIVSHFGSDIDADDEAEDDWPISRVLFRG